ncbi:MAG: hybrid sensor histidine kinase/response regulator [Polaromonas sp.]|jgi:PAS domain S-box-containing protein|nr:hybrid sensor histidine kinase/response regulator [Polaromonas sp.]
MQSRHALAQTAPHDAAGRPSGDDASSTLCHENAELRIRLREMQETLDAIHMGDVDALIVNGDIYTLQSASATADRLRQDVLDQMEDAVFAFDNDGNIVFINAAAERRYGVKASEMTGLGREYLFTEHLAPEVQEMESGWGDTEQPRVARLSKHVLSRGGSIYVETVNSVLHDGRGHVLGSLAVVRDVTERIHAAALLRESEQRLRHINESLETTVQKRTRELMVAEDALRQAQKMEAVGHLTGGIAHDFNNLLAGMSTSLQMLQRRLQANRTDDLERYLAMAQESTRRAAALTQRLLAFARRQTLEPIPVDINQLTAGLVGMIERTVGPNIDIDVQSQTGLWLTKIDGAQLENSLLNLCINARDSMPGTGGCITVQSANMKLDTQLAGQFGIAPGDYVSLAVKDAGSGMPSEVIARAFDPFFTTKPVGQGTGLGLSMVYGFARQSGGHVRVFSTVGKGTTIEMFFPRYFGPPAPAELPEDAQNPASGDGNGETILIVEDEETIRVLMAEALQESGFQTLVAENGPAALRIFESGVPIDLLVSDVGLPGGLNGRQIADAARVKRPSLKVLFVTGYAENAAIREGQLEGGMAVLTKPFDLTTLITRIRRMMLSRT